MRGLRYVDVVEVVWMGVEFYGLVFGRSEGDMGMCCWVLDDE